jgi:hypothetical protein
MVNRIRLLLDQQEYDALAKAANCDTRSLEGEVRHIVRVVLQQRAFLAVKHDGTIRPDPADCEGIENELMR